MNIINQIKKFGLTEYEAKSYYALLQKEKITPTEVAQLARIPRTRVYAVLEKLEKKGFCLKVPGNNNKYKVIEPNVTLNKIFLEYETKKDALKQISTVLSNLYDKQFSDDDPLDYVEIIQDRNLIIQRMHQQENKSTESIFSMNKGPYAMKPQDIIQGNINPFNQKVDYCYLYESDECKNLDMIKVMRIFQKYGVNIRIVETLPIKMAIFDNKRVLLSLEDKISTQISFTAMFINHETLARALGELFQSYLEKSLSFDEFMRTTNYKDSINIINELWEK